MICDVIGEEVYCSYGDKGIAVDLVIFYNFYF